MCRIGVEQKKLKMARCTSQLCSVAGSSDGILRLWSQTDPGLNPGLDKSRGTSHVAHSKPLNPPNGARRSSSIILILRRRNQGTGDWLLYSKILLNVIILGWYTWKTYVLLD